MLDELGLDEARAAWEISKRWSEFVGEEGATHSRPVVVRHGVLEIEVDSSVRAQELSLRRPQLTQALRQQFGERAPKALRFRVGTLGPPR